MSKSNLLIDETPIMFQPSLAKMIGLHEAIVLQTLRFWCGQKKSGRVFEDERWIYNTLEQWREFSFPFWTTRTIGEIFRTLETMGLIKSRQFDLVEGKAMKYYTLTSISYNFLTSERLDHVEDSSLPMWKNLPDHVEESSRSARARLIKQYTEKQTEKASARSQADPPVNSDSSVETSQSADNPQHFPDPQKKTTLRSTEEEKTATAVKKDPPNSARPPRNTEADFDKLWAVYPRKDNKAGARKSFLRVEVSIDTLIAAVNAQKRLWNDPKFIPYLQTWLNQKRWEDESIVKQAEDAPNAPQKKTGWVAQAEDDLQSFKNWMLENRPDEWNEHLPSMDMRWWVEYTEKKNAVEF